ncbi:unnamed protein product [Sphenostylis stenocarpa]|uniref:Uncharacterized protein n=1 Tax=Sphenostylis stenocarpa TaxID=92480 RepID=A0AA86SV13_9FABA|nr:unnamed protein product [Sphenostylis stenocarpa]
MGASRLKKTRRRFHAGFLALKSSFLAHLPALILSNLSKEFRRMAKAVQNQCLVLDTMPDNTYFRWGDDPSELCGHECVLPCGDEPLTCKKKP